ncbi:MAG: glycosyltransferase family 4 protein [Anaerolineae bacterium]|nr:glycosyltransferase family 4 protein [Anaerolineae bacterium]
MSTVALTADSLLEKHGNGQMARNLVAALLRLPPAHDTCWRFLPYQDRPIDAVLAALQPDAARVDIAPLPPKTRTRFRNLLTPLAGRYPLDGVNVLHALRPSETLKLARRCPQIVTLLDLGNPLARGRAWLLNKASLRAMVRHADLVITISEATRRHALERLALDPAQVTAVPLGIADDYYLPVPDEAVTAVRQHYHLPADYLLAAGHITPHKNLPRLLAAYRSLHDRYPDLPPLVLIGGSAAGLLTPGDAESGLIRTPGYVPQAHLPALMRGARYLVFPSLFEGFGLPALEAQAVGTPPLVSDLPVFHETLQDTVLFFDPYQVESIANTLATALNDPALRDDLSRRGLTNSARFRWEVAAAAYLDAYRRFA